MQYDPSRSMAMPHAGPMPLPGSPMMAAEPEPPTPLPPVVPPPVVTPKPGLATPVPPSKPPTELHSRPAKPTSAELTSAMEILARADAALGGTGDPVVAATRAQPTAPKDSHLEYRSEGRPTIVRIPRGTRLTVSMMPHRKEVLSNVEVYGEYTPSLDPGKYIFKLVRNVDPPACSIVWCIRGEFLVDVTEAQYRRLVRLRPKLAKGIVTTDGARWRCGFVGCNMDFTSPVQIIQHEGEHFGRDFLHEPDEFGFDDALREVQEKAMQHGRMLEAQRTGQPYAPVQ